METTRTYPHPLVHLNGSGAKNLEEQWLAVYTASSRLLNALAESRPHPRDYYTLPDGDAKWNAARDEHHTLELQVLEVQDRFTKLLQELSAK